MLVFIEAFALVFSLAIGAALAFTHPFGSVPEACGILIVALGSMIWLETVASGRPRRASVRRARR